MASYGIQLYSVRDLASEDLFGAMKAVKELGYEFVEFAGFFGHTAEEVKEELDKLGLGISGTHSPWQDLRPEVIKETVAYHKTIGNPRYIIPGADLSTLEKIDEFVEVVNAAQPILAEAGITLGYHNHSHEFVLMPWGSTIHAELERRTNMEFEIDTFWAFNAGIDPIQTVMKLRDRISVIHVKDGFRGGKGIPLGKGEAPVKAVVDMAKAEGIVMVVESETLTPSGYDEAKECIEYLRSLD